jgi:hypothetical protein
MPSKSKAQQHLFAAAEHGANFPMAQKLRSSMTLGQLHDFAATKTKALPAHVKPETPAKARMMTKPSAAPMSKNAATASSEPAMPHPHRNLGKYLHQKGGY